MKRSILWAAILAGSLVAVVLSLGQRKQPVEQSSARSFGDTTSSSTPRAIDTNYSQDDCGMSLRREHDNPDSLLIEFLRRDGEGEFLGSSDWLSDALDCPEAEAGPDNFTVIQEYRILGIQRDSDLISAAVESHVLGNFCLAKLTPQDTFVVDTVRIRRYEPGWRIVSPALRQYVLKDYAIKLGHLKPEDSPPPERTGPRATGVNAIRPDAMQRTPSVPPPIDEIFAGKESVAHCRTDEAMTTDLDSTFPDLGIAGILPR